MKTFLQGLNRWLDRVAICANAAGTLVVLLLVVVVNYDVVVRGAGGQPFLGAVELVQFSMVLIVFLQLPDVVRANRLTRSDGFLSIAGNRFPRFRSILDRIINTVASIFMLLIAIAMWPEFLEMFETQDFFGVPGVFTAPWWPIKLVIFVSAALSSILFAFKVLLRESESPKADLPTDPIDKKRTDLS